MTLFRFWIFFALVASSAAADAAVYGKVENGRVSILYSDIQPSDRSFRLYSNANRFIVRPGAYRKGRIPDQYSGPVVMPTIYDRHIEAAASETNVDAALIRAVISVESGYNPLARSPRGAMGLMQLMPETARKYGVKNIRDPAQNIQGGARYLRALMDMFGDDLKLVLAGYNAGEEAVMKYGRRIPPFAETVAYVPRVLSRYKKTPAAAPVMTGG
jgi:soluble lytic murein transglycosylase-like protein